MNQTKKLALLIALFCFASINGRSFACTIISAGNSSAMYFAGNEDQTPNLSYLVIDKRGMYNVLYFATLGKNNTPVIQMGVNEVGLAFDVNRIPIGKLKSYPERKSAKNLFPNVLGELESVEDVILILDKYNWGGDLRAQFHFADKSGDAVVIFPGPDGELAYKRKPKAGGHLISTNFNLTNLEGGEWQCNRYTTADRMLTDATRNKTATVNTMAAVLKATQQTKRVRTLFSVVFDLTHLKTHLYMDRRFDKAYVFDVKKELSVDSVYRSTLLRDLIGDFRN